MALKTYALDAVSVLVLEDNRFMRSILVNVIKGLGVTHVLEARDGNEALEELRNHPADIIVMDWELDGMPGSKFLQTVRSGKRGLNPLTPVIVVSANTIARNILQARDTGMTEFLAKPVSAASLYARIVSIIENPRRFVRTGSYFGPDRRRRFEAGYMGPKRRSEDRTLDDADDIDAVNRA
ncbi:MAG: response regulator [Alphaproteobacteria bacterium]|nr:response regulator [Alphaproteobacteria bacterium]